MYFSKKDALIHIHSHMFFLQCDADTPPSQGQSIKCKSDNALFPSLDHKRWHWTLKPSPLLWGSQVTGRVHSWHQPPDMGANKPAGDCNPKPSIHLSEVPNITKQSQAVPAMHYLNSWPTEFMSTINGCFPQLSFGEICNTVIGTGTVILCDFELSADVQQWLPMWTFLHFWHLGTSSWFLAQLHIHNY